MESIPINNSGEQMPVRLGLKIIAIANQKGGVGKTTTAVNLGAALAEKGQRILLIDLDPQANATSSLGMQDFEGETLYEPLLGQTAIATKILPTRLERLFLVPANIDLAGAEVEIARMPDHLLRLARTLQPLRADSAFDFVLLDCPPSLGILMSNALAAADEILTPIQCEYFALEGLVKIVRVVEQVRDSGANPNIQIGGILMTMFDSRTNLSAQVVWNATTFQYEANDPAVVPGAPSNGVRFILYALDLAGQPIATQPIGRADFMDESSGNTQTLHVLVVGTTTDPPVTYLDYAVSVTVGAN